MVQIVADRHSQPLLQSLIASGQAGIKHPPPIELVWIRANVHRPQHRIVPATGMSNEQRVANSKPTDAIFADRMRDKIVVRQHQVKQVVQAVVEQNVYVAEGFAAAN